MSLIFNFFSLPFPRQILLFRDISNKYIDMFIDKDQENSSVDGTNLIEIINYFLDYLHKIQDNWN